MTNSLEELKAILLLEVEKMKGEIELLLWMEHKELATLHTTGSTISSEHRLDNKY